MRTLNQATLCKVEEYIKRYQKENGASPSFRDIQRGTRMSSLNLVSRYVLALEGQGRIRRTIDGSIKLPRQLDPGNATLTPLVGDIACGQPNTAIEYIEESFALPKSLFGSGELMMLRASGESMVEVGIDDGDLIVIRRQDYANDGEIVVALIDDRTTLKRIYHQDGKTILHPENSKMKDIIVKRCDIQGVLVSCIKMY